MALAFALPPAAMHCESTVRPRLRTESKDTYLFRLARTLFFWSEKSGRINGEEREEAFPPEQRRGHVVSVRGYLRDFFRAIFTALCGHFLLLPRAARSERWLESSPLLRNMVLVFALFFVG